MNRSVPINGRVGNVFPEGARQRGFFEIGIYHPKTEINMGTLWRSAFQLGAAGIFTVGRRYERQSSDTLKAWRHIPLRHYANMEALWESLPNDAPVVAVEEGGTPLRQFEHPQRAVYLLGAEDHGLPPAVIERCHRHVSIESVAYSSFNVAVAGSLVMYHRMFGFRQALGVAV